MIAVPVETVEILKREIEDTRAFSMEQLKSVKEPISCR